MGKREWEGELRGWQIVAIRNASRDGKWLPVDTDFKQIVLSLSFLLCRLNELCLVLTLQFLCPRSPGKCSKKNHRVPSESPTRQKPQLSPAELSVSSSHGRKPANKVGTKFHTPLRTGDEQRAAWTCRAVARSTYLQKGQKLKKKLRALVYTPALELFWLLHGILSPCNSGKNTLQNACHESLLTTSSASFG